MVKKMRVVLKSAYYASLRKLVETILEGTEVGQLRFDPVNQEFQLAAIDSLWVCHMNTTFSKQSFSRFELKEPLCITTHLKPIHDFLRVGRSDRIVSFQQTNNGQVKLADVSTNENVTMKQVEEHYDSQHRDHRSWPSFEISSVELGNIILDLAVSGMDMMITMEPSGNVLFHSSFDTGDIWHESKNGQNEVIQARTLPNRRQESGKYLIKYLKIICSLTHLAPTTMVYLGDNQVSLEISDTSNNIRFQLSLVTYRGARGKVVPDEYCSYATRIF